MHLNVYFEKLEKIFNPTKVINLTVVNYNNITKKYIF